MLLFCFVAASIQGRAQTNLALSATVARSAGGSGSTYGVHNFNDNVIQPFGSSVYGWVQDGAWLEYTWTNIQTIGQVRFHFDDRPMKNCVVQYWNAAENKYIDLQTYTRPTAATNNDLLNLNELLTTTKLRFNSIMPVVSGGNPNFREIQVFSTHVAIVVGANPSCGASDGTIKVTGLKPGQGYFYSYLKDGIPQGDKNFVADGSGIASIKDLGAGAYSQFKITEPSVSLTIAKTITLIAPGPIVNAVSNQTLCSGASTNAVSFGGTGTSYTWTNNNTAIGLAASGMGNIASFHAKNTTNAPITATITVTPVDGDCPGTPTSFTITVNPKPSVTLVAVPTGGTYKGGDHLDFTVNFTENVIFNTNGRDPYIDLTLNTGGAVKANYVSGSGSASLLFRYTVAATDEDPDGITIGSSLNLNGGTLQNTNGCDAANIFNNIPSTSSIKIENKDAQIITFKELSAKTYGDADFDAGASASSTLPVTYTSSNTDVAVIVAGQVHIVGAGNTTITASQVGDEAYLPATAVQQALVVHPKNITVTADVKTKVYGDADPKLTYTYAPSLVGNDHFSGSLSRTAGENAGMYAINQSTLALSNNYTVNYSGKHLTITTKAVTVTAEVKSKVYGDADPKLTYTVFPALVGTDVFSGSLNRTAGENAGTYAINQGTLALSNNYAVTYSGKNLTITPKAVTVTAEVKTKVYGDADPKLTYTVSPALVGTDVFNGSLSRMAGEVAGTYAIGQGTLALNGNYTVSYSGKDLTITPKAVAVIADVLTKVYGDADPALTYTVSPALVAGDAFTGSLNRAAGENTGTYAIDQGTLALNGNYTVSYTGKNLTITPKAVTVTADVLTKVYGDADPALTYTVSPALVAGDAFTGSLSRTAGENAGTYPIGQGTLALNNNYTLSYSGTHLTITQKLITVTAAAKTKVYGDADPALTYTISPALVAGDALTGSLSRTAGENAGTYSIVQHSLALNGNYQLNYVAANLVINKAVLTATAGDKTICPGNAIAPVPVSYTGFKYGDNVAAISSEPVIIIPSYKEAGNYPLTPARGSAANYSFDYVNGQLTVLPEPTGAIAQNQTAAGVVSGYQLTAPTGASFVWSTSETTNAITVRSSGNYSVTVTNQQGCHKNFALQVKLQTVSVPNTFSPNGDGINDYWLIPELANYPSAYVTVVNRGGQVVFESRNFTRWDGKHNGRELPAGVYFYRVRKAPGAEPVTGWLNLLK